MVTERDTGNLPAVKAAEARPAYLRLEFLEAEGARVEQGWRGATRDIIAHKCEGV